MNKDTTKSINKALDILELFLRDKKEMGLTEICELSGLNRTTVSRIVTTLVKRDYLRQFQKRGKYSLGTMYFSYTGVIKRGLSIRSTAAPYLMKLSKSVNEPVVLAILDGTKNLFTELFDDSYRPYSLLTIAPAENSKIPLHSTSVGKAILADMSDEDLQEYFDIKKLKKYTPNTITDINVIKKQLLNSKKEGVAIDDEEYGLGVRSVATCLRNENGKAVAAICIIAPTVRLTRFRIRELIPEIKQIAMNISMELGFQKN